MMKPLRLETRRELCAAIAERYRAADRQSKKAILDEFVKVTGYHRKSAIRIMKGKQVVESKKSPIGKRIHNAAVDEALIVLWEAADRICGKRLKALLPTLVESMERHGHLNLEETIRERLLSLSAATIDRRLAQVRVKAFGARRKKRTLNRVRKLVAVKTFADWEKTRPGFMEVDLVTHSGPSASGSFVHTLVLTDVASGWTECLALPVREQSLIVEAITAVSARLPFPLLGLDTDNDSAFMNDTLWDYCQQKGLEFTRCRAYRKNDQAWVEQKNGAVVRKLVGYGRLEGRTLAAKVRDYGRDLCITKNC
jgi:Integrase core domain